ncbi:hypothetical protein AB0K51_01235 [Kitasatospora sp. NPDC049285]|uniref:hypothetical protein n=1 Tax=Kitasatospora sp. NPDC049285 TaxID=3157096 RepID=UPI00341A92BF
MPDDTADPGPFDDPHAHPGVGPESPPGPDVGLTPRVDSAGHVSVTVTTPWGDTSNSDEWHLPDGGTPDGTTPFDPEHNPLDRAIQQATHPDPFHLDPFHLAPDPDPFHLNPDPFHLDPLLLPSDLPGEQPGAPDLAPDPAEPGEAMYASEDSGYDGGGYGDGAYGDGGYGDGGYGDGGMTG